MTEPRREFTQITWSPQVEEDCRRLVRLAVFEDLGRAYDWTTVALVPEGTKTVADIVARQAGVIAGLAAVPIILDEMDIEAGWQPHLKDGELAAKGTKIATINGHARDLLTSERTILNFVGRLSGIATLTSRFVQAIAGTKAAIYDTRKTTPGWRRLEKCAVQCGGGRNHRTGLFDAVLIKDNHLVIGRKGTGVEKYSPAEAVVKAREFIRTSVPDEGAEPMLLEVEVDSLDQLREVLPMQPDIVLLDNMSLDMLRQAVEIRDAEGRGVELEASGGVNLDTVADIARTGVERISSGALTHSAVCFDVALDFRTDKG